MKKGGLRPREKKQLLEPLHQRISGGGDRVPGKRKGLPRGEKPSKRRKGSKGDKKGGGSSQGVSFSIKSHPKNLRKTLFVKREKETPS